MNHALFDATEGLPQVERSGCTGRERVKSAWCQPDLAIGHRQVFPILGGLGMDRRLRRIAQTRNAKSDYYSETHASPSPDASQVIWSSNWGESGGPVADYISRPSWPESSSRE